MNLNLSFINEICSDKVAEIVESIKVNGWNGCPILTYGEGTLLLTGSHRLASLQLLDENDELDSDIDCFADISDIVEDKINERAETQGCEPWEVEIEFDNIGWILEGSWVEEFKNEIPEWG